MRKQFPTFTAFASASLDDIYGEKLNNALHHVTANHLESGVWINRTSDASSPHFEWIPFPRVAQLAPIYGIQAHDFNGDGILDLYALQNSLSTQPETGWWRGGLSQLLLGKGDGSFSCVSSKESGLCVADDAKALTIVDINQDQCLDIIVTQNNGHTLTFSATNPQLRKMRTIKLVAKGANAHAIGAKLHVSYHSGDTQHMELTPTSGYLTQSPSLLKIPLNKVVKKISVQWPTGVTSTHTSGLEASTIILKQPSQ